MKPIGLHLWLTVGLLLAFTTFAAAVGLEKVGAPPSGKLYHGVYLGGITGEEDDLTPADVDAYETNVARQVAWVYFSHNWYRSREFPLATATWIRDRGAVPYIRLMLRSQADETKVKKEKVFLLNNIVTGQLDTDLQNWAHAARDFGTPLIVEYGTECNGEWFAWNARWNGGKQKRKFGDPIKFDGAERFVAAYRHIVALMRNEGATNITWVFHVNRDDEPEKDWNQLEDYYPGDDVVDWIAISAYGSLTPQDNYQDTFRDAVDSCYARLQQKAPTKPVIIAEFGCTTGNPIGSAQDWAALALDDLLSFRWQNVIGFSWWNERWENDNNPAHDTTMRVQDIPELANVFRTKFNANSSKLQLTPVLIPASP